MYLLLFVFPETENGFEDQGLCLQHLFRELPKSGPFGVIPFDRQMGRSYGHQANAGNKIITQMKSEGRINLGLFFGKKELNVAYGWRTDYIHAVWPLVYFLQLHQEFVQSSSVQEKGQEAEEPLCHQRNHLLGQCISIGSWLAQFFLCLRYNMLTQDDKKNAWTSDGQAQLGSSFWFVVISAFTSLLNICLLLCVSTREKETENIHFTGDEKINAAIMLY
ncbi:uncharacterized protein LOC113386426 [Ctenocephalides felis]|uniref:uncharacterized protein LOC113386426 n=1 Tax=Ctenocephalides felis TaxID=7515 RepID=UPI000E6E4A6E|nr:uncharacterized protein LOC113386426 [Ctenocephalides felis]